MEFVPVGSKRHPQCISADCLVRRTQNVSYVSDSVRHLLTESATIAEDGQHEAEVKPIAVRLLLNVEEVYL